MYLVRKQLSINNIITPSFNVFRLKRIIRKYLSFFFQFIFESHKPVLLHQTHQQELISIHMYIQYLNQIDK